MLTGAELSIAVTVASKIISTFSMHGLKKTTDEILGDQELANLLGELYKLNEEQAERQNRKWEMASEKIKLLAVYRGPKDVLVRYSIARSAYFLAQSYKVNVKKDTARAKLQAYKLGKGKQNVDDRHHPTEVGSIFLEVLDAHLSSSGQNTNSTPQHIVRSSSTMVFNYSVPVGTPENPAIHCPVGSELTIPKGFKPGNIIFYPLSQASNHQIDTPISGNRSVDNASELIAEADHLAEILVSVNNSNVSIATTFYSLDLNNETDAGGSDFGSSGDLTSDC
ncbi:hypothetical protein F5050DRAFT_1716217 [Lentinula boryana]|uniref:Uncharacterized protein n=1 Tax=Lentinula boryana TaxID=40481 RepID=A0ABQ8PY46_9AGAR|nr:hypothetical protein F5050DRAFT_1716217 [Lentinula boryana]